MTNKGLRFAFYVAACVAAGAIGWCSGRDYILSRIVRKAADDIVSALPRIWASTRNSAEGATQHETQNSKSPNSESKKMFCNYFI